MIDEETWRTIWRVTCVEPDGLPSFPHPLVLQRFVVDAPTYLVDRSQGNLGNRHLWKLTLAGSGQLRIAERSWSLTAGSVMLLARGDTRPVYRYPGAAGDEPWQWVMCSFRGADDLVDDLLQRHGSVYRLGTEHPVITQLETWRRFDGSLQRPDIEEGAQLVLRLLLALHGTTRKPEDDRDARLVALVRRALVAHREDPDATIGGIARELGVSPEHLARRFRACTGRTIRDEWSQQRLERSAELLQGTAMPVAEIARRIGYGHGAHFTRAFKARYGCTPTAFRTGRAGR